LRASRDRFFGKQSLPKLADLNQDGLTVSQIEELNAIGKHFGIRFREMRGSMRDLTHTVGDSGMVLAKLTPGTSKESAVLVLAAKNRNRFLLNQDDEDKVVSMGSLRKQLDVDENGSYQWLLVQPMLSAENASRFHYQTGTQAEPLEPLRRFMAFLKPEAKDIRAIFVFSVIIGLLSLTTPLAVEAVVNTIAFGRYLQPLIVLSFIVLVFLGFRASLNVLMTIVTEIIQRKLFVRTVEDLSYRLTRVPLST
jgi:putative ABC transport system ATP-binding protein